MQENDLPKRKQIRLKNYDYSQNGYYFVTICTHKRQNLFGEINNGKMVLNDIGKIVDFTWNDLINHNDIKLHQYVIMPDHIHGIIEICNDRMERFITVPQSQKNTQRMERFITVPQSQKNTQRRERSVTVPKKNKKIKKRGKKL